jgi:hypothetical protein
MEGMEDLELLAHGTPVNRFSCKTHADLRSRLTEGYMHSLKEDFSDAMLRMLALRVTLRLWEDNPSTHQIFWWMMVLYEWRSMEKNQYMNDVSTKNWTRNTQRSEGHINFSQ